MAQSSNLAIGTNIICGKTQEFLTTNPPSEFDYLNNKKWILYSYSLLYEYVFPGKLISVASDINYGTNKANLHQLGGKTEAKINIFLVRSCFMINLYPTRHLAIGCGSYMSWYSSNYLVKYSIPFSIRQPDEMVNNGLNAGGLLRAKYDIVSRISVEGKVLIGTTLKSEKAYVAQIVLDPNNGTTGFDGVKYSYYNVQYFIGLHYSL